MNARNLIEQVAAGADPRAVLQEALSLGPGAVDQKGTESLRRAKLYAKNYGDLESAVLSAGFYAKRQNREMFVYEGNSFMHAVWRVTYKSSDYLDPINNTGSRVISVTPDLTMKVHPVHRGTP